MTRQGNRKFEEYSNRVPREQKFKSAGISSTARSDNIFEAEQPFATF
jgi:hypothetical protein